MDSQPVAADVVIVLGGGDGSRLRKAINIYDKGLVEQLVLVDTSRRDWRHIIRNYSANGAFDEKNVTFLEGSVNTRTDAKLSLFFCRENSIDNILVVTSPYHTRRAHILFEQVFKESGIQVTTVSNGDYGNLFKPNESWWRHRRTLETVWMEFGKVVFAIMDPLLPAGSLQ
ncbi:YdcF family protein [Desulfopila inferna]|uniref:YdcF family protein n=1 Tax=Desulfopila inferna TaxID=468528 RepID=UPI0019669BA5|nr:YdcF family protein [Desulfopila inferna]MBM9605795.1 YdcF family protein [Desulfopila inferna]